MRLGAALLQFADLGGEAFEDLLQFLDLALELPHVGAVCAAFSIEPLASSAVATAFCTAPMNVSLDSSWEAILLIRSSPVAIIFFRVGLSRSIGPPPRTG
jgi:hypothetical protein